MTDQLPPLWTQIAPPSQPPAVPLKISAPVLAGVPKAPTAEEEDYTIKCICDFAGDDGSTIYCETCDTWQHIECYYPDSIDDCSREDFSHSCVGCKPRPLDKPRAIQSQQKRLDAALKNTSHVQDGELLDKKPKRPATKNHKKKTKPPPAEISITNGAHYPTIYDHAKHPVSHENPAAPAAKKSKTLHKSSHSISSQGPKRSPSYNAARGHPPGHSANPANTPPDFPIDCEVFPPTPGFVASYSDRAVRIVDVNSFASLQVSSTLAAWPRDPTKMKHDTNLMPVDVFRELPKNIAFQPLKVEHKTLTIPGEGTAHLRYITTPVPIKKDAMLLELNGAIDFQTNYCARMENRWEQLTFPLPFVFFHDILPLCIDTRVEGSNARYVRRSCRPTARLETYLDPDNMALYHFMLVADRDIHPKEQITLPWDFRLVNPVKSRWLGLLGLDDDFCKPVDPPTEDEYLQLREFAALLLGEYGSCACELGRECAFIRFFRNWQGKWQAPPRPAPPKKRPRAIKQSKAHPAVSPTSTGHATNSRAPSEGRLEDVHEYDHRSLSGSARSKGPSRERTPSQRQPSLDAFGMLSAEPTEREKRKAAAFEENLRRTEEQKPKKKRPRITDGTTTSSGKSKSTKRNSSSASAAPSSATSHQYVDASTSRTKSNSPKIGPVAENVPEVVKRARSREAKSTQTLRPRPAVPRSVYVNHATQTDDGPWYLSPYKPQPHRRVISLARRLLQDRHICNAHEPVTKKGSLNKSMAGSPVASEPRQPKVNGSPAVENPPPVVVPTPTAPGDSTPRTPLPAAPRGDNNMPDASGLSPTAAKPPVPSISEQGSLPAPTSKIKAAELRVQMPPVPTFNGPSSINSTPLSSSIGSVVNSPFSSNSLPSPFAPPAVNGVAHPSPQRKKLSLSDYTKSRLNKKASSGLATAATTGKGPSSNQDLGIKSAGGQENSSPTAAGGTRGHERVGGESSTISTIAKSSAVTTATTIP